MTVYRIIDCTVGIKWKLFSKTMKIFIVFLLCVAAWAKPARRNPMENPGMFEGDILGIESPEDRNAIPRDSQRWPNGVIPFVLDSTLKPHWAALKKGMDHITARTCIQFVPRTDETDYIRMFKGEGCYSHWGRIGKQQSLSLGDGCHDIGTVVHELLHAVGFEHEHNRSDRDDYLVINWSNIKKEEFSAFSKLTPKQNRLLTNFDFDSVMLYGETAFSKDEDNLKSMKAKNGKFMREVYDKAGMSKSDVKRVKLLYNC